MFLVDIDAAWCRMLLLLHIPCGSKTAAVGAVSTRGCNGVVSVVLAPLHVLYLCCNLKHCLKFYCFVLPTRIYCGKHRRFPLSLQQLYQLQLHTQTKGPLPWTTDLPTTSTPSPPTPANR